MKRLKLLAAVAVLGVFACEEATPPPPVGSIVGQVAIEGTGIDGVSVNLSNGNSTTTSGGGSYRFDNVEGGAYTITISGYPSDATFDATSAAATISSAGQSVTVNFTGSYIRTASVMGSVTVENQGLRGVTVSLSGVSSSTAVTDDNGQYAFTGLRMGSYSVEISGFDTDEVGFSSTASAVSVGVGESKIVSFDGTYLRTAGIQGQVSVEGEGGLAGVNVSLTGGPDNVSESVTTDASGQYSFSRLRAGDYSVGISGYDTDDYEFEVTSQNVTVALGETANVPFTGVLLRTSGISGRVSVEGMGLADVAVTLSGGGMDADRSTATDDGGTYAFAGLAAGDYTVSIAVEGDAYVFDSMSQDVTVGDDETAIANFDGTHATTASVSGMLYLDEAAKNNSYDEGEDPFPAAGVPVVLVGPGVEQQRPNATDEKGQFMFSDLKAGAYQLVVTITPEVQALLGDYAYGGPSTGYAFELGVGEAATQNIPFDITHQTVSFAVTLKSGEDMGPALPGATVNLYADVAGKDMVGTGETGENGTATIKVARGDAAGSTVYAGIEAADYHVADEMQAVTWDPKSPATAASNDADIVNLTANVSFAGKTITTAAGGGEALDGWAVDIMMMGDDGMVAVEDAAEELDEEGMAAFTRTVEADGLGTTYYFAIDHDTLQADSNDGGQAFMVTPMASDAGTADGSMLSYEHDGLSLAGAMDLGTLEVKYTTQQLRVWTHQERDQVPGFTYTLSGGDNRPSRRTRVPGHPTWTQDTGIFFELRHLDAAGRSRPVPDYENRIRHPQRRSSRLNGVAIYDRVPADLDIIVKASTDANRKIINDDEAQAFKDFEANKVRGGAFGAEGGFHHTVSLCPETADDPDQNSLTGCSTFAYVYTRTVSGEASRTDVTLHENPSQGFNAPKTTYHSDISVSLIPERRNVQGDNFGSTTAKENVDTEARELGTYSISGVGDGVYNIRGSDGFSAVGWSSTAGPYHYSTDEGEPAQPADVTVNFHPRTLDLYGIVKDTEGRELPGVEVTMDGQTVTTDDYGRYLLDDMRTGHKYWTVSKSGYVVDLANGAPRTDHAIENDYSLRITSQWSHNTRQVDFVLKAVDPTGTVSGTVTHLQTRAPIEGVRVFAIKGSVDATWDLSTPGLVQNDATSMFDGVAFADVDTTDANGEFSLEAPAGALTGSTTTVIAYASGVFFTPDRHIPTVLEGQEFTVSFLGLKLSAITGRVVDAAKKGMSGVTVTATGSATNTHITRTATTNASGLYHIRVPWGPYSVTASKTNYTFDPVLNAQLPAETTVTMQDITGTSSGAVITSAVRQTNEAGTQYNGDFEVEWTVSGTTTDYTYKVQTKVGTGDWTDGATPTGTDANGAGTSPDLHALAEDGAFLVRVLADHSTDETKDIASATVTVGAVDPSATLVTTGATATRRDGNDIHVTWTAVNNSNSSQRVVVQVAPAVLGGSASIWFAHPTPVDAAARTVSLTVADDYSESWTSVDGATVVVTAADLNKAITVAVETAQGTVTTDNPYKRSGTATIAAKPTS